MGRFENHRPQKLNGSSIRHRLVACRSEFGSGLSGLERIGPYRKKEETRTLIAEENIRKNLAKPWVSSRQLSVGTGTALIATERVKLFRGDYSPPHPPPPPQPEDPHPEEPLSDEPSEWP